MGEETYRDVGLQGLVRVLLVVLRDITPQHQRPSVGLHRMALEFRAVEGGWHCHVVKFPRSLPIRFVFQNPMNLGGLRRRTLGVSEACKLVHDGTNMRMAWVLFC